MTEPEKIQFNKMQKDVHEIKENMGKIFASVDRLNVALMGSDIGQDGGMVQRTKDNAQQLQELRKETDTKFVSMSRKIEELTEESRQNKIYVKIIWMLAGIVGTAVLGFVLKLVLNKGQG